MCANPSHSERGSYSIADEEVASEVETELQKIDHERKAKKEVGLATIRKDVDYLLREYVFHNKCIKYNGLHLNLKEKAKNFKGQLTPRDMPQRDFGQGKSEWRNRSQSGEQKSDGKKREEPVVAATAHRAVAAPSDQE